MLREFKAYVEKEQLFQRTERILLAVSGGVDSVVMCELFHQAGLKFAIAHCNFNLRDKESEGDEEFVEILAEHYMAEYHCASFDTAAFAKKSKLSIQAAARTLRYEWFHEILAQYGYTRVATAHHADDVVETFLINLTRGTGIAGFHGILPRQGNVIRPLLSFDKKKILRFAEKNKLKFRHDSSNDSDKYLRNRVRKELIPVLTSMNPSINQAILEEVERIREVESVYRSAIEDLKKKIAKRKGDKLYISIDALKNNETPATLLFEILSPYGFQNEIIGEIRDALSGAAGKQFFSGTHRLLKDRAFLILESKSKDLKKIKKEETKQITRRTKQIDLNDLRIRFKVADVNVITKQKNVGCFDYSKLEFPLELRRWKKGDSFQPFGMNGRKKKLSDFFVDQKLSLDQKEDVWVLCSGGKIAWVVGMRIDERFRVGEHSKKIFVAELV